MVNNFNSIKVRLELGIKQGDLITFVYFNSIKVRLEPQQLGYNHLEDAQFQFHKGAIRTRIV